MIPFYSKRNQVYGVPRQGRAAVEKHFSDMGDWRRETDCYARLSSHLPIPEVLVSEPGLLVTGYCPQPTMLAVLKDQERLGGGPEPWQALADWLLRCEGLYGELPSDGNLRNFLWDAAANTVIGLDLEGFQPCPLAFCGAELTAALLTYTPADTQVKRYAAEVLTKALDIPKDAVENARQRLDHRRLQREQEELSGIVLAGGASRRMGRNKAKLPLQGETFLQRQVEKLWTLGIQDVMVSCPEELAWPGIRTIPDIFPGRGPMGGLHACLKAARHPRCLVLSVDAPLVPLSALAHLCREHRGGVTALRHNGKQEPLIAVYDREVAQTIQMLIEVGGAPVRSLENWTSWCCFDYLGPEELLINCNTPEDLVQLNKLLKAYQAVGLPL